MYKIIFNFNFDGDILMHHWSQKCEIWLQNMCVPAYTTYKTTFFSHHLLHTSDSA